MERHTDTDIARHAREGRSRPSGWLCGEPTLDDLLADPVMHIVMRRSRTSADDLRRLAGRLNGGPAL
ncbi:MAG: hypothetical protein AB7O45_01270 [Alphaproteobacteria bacterium]